MELNLIVACGYVDGHIGDNNRLPWRQSADLAHFKSLTTNNIIIMGRNTFESIGKPLPNRTTIVVTKNEHFNPGSGDVYVCNNIQAIDILLERLVSEKKRDVFVCGGKQIYELLLPYVSTMIVTHVYAPKADPKRNNTFIDKPYSPHWYIDTYSPTHTRDEKNEFDYQFKTYRRRAASKAIPFPKSIH